MAFTPRREEIEAVADAIEGQDSLEGVAREALKASFKLLQRRNLWAVATDASIIYAPFASENDCYTALAGGKVDGFVDEEGIKALRKEDKSAIPTLGGRAMVLRLTGPLALEATTYRKDREAHLFSNHLCVHCEQAVNKHDTKTNACPGGAGTKLKQLTL